MARLSLLILSMLLTGLLSGQTSDQEKLREAKVFFGHERYAEALSILSNSRQLSRSNDEARFLMAVCQYQTNALDAAYLTLTELTREQRPPYPECWLYLGKVLHAQHRFREASDHYKTYLRSIFPNDPNRRMVIEEIRRCANGIELQYQSTTVVAENLGPEVNTAGDEFAPVSSPSYADRLYFSAIRPNNTGGLRDRLGNPDPQWGDYCSDLFSTRVVQGRWSDVAPMHYLLNSSKHEVLLGFSDDGQALYYFKGWELQRGEIVVDTFRKVEERTMSSTPLPGPLRPEQGDNYPVFYRDTLVIFASNRPGGYGGWDLYKASKRGGRWMAPENLGPTVNTAFDETTPFLANDGQTLYFSSNDSRKSMGGLDVFKTVLIPQNGRWLPPENVGMPVNSAGDDAFFKLSRDGFTGYFASSRKDGYGQRDIYVAFYQDFLPEMEYPAGYFRETAAAPKPKPALPVESAPVPATASDFSLSGGADFDAPSSVVTDQDASQPATNSSMPPRPVSMPASPYAPIIVENASVAVDQYDRLDQLGDQLVRNRDLRLILTAFHTMEGATGVALFAAIAKAEAVARYLLRRGVAEDQLFMRGLLLGPSGDVDRVEIAFTDRSGQMPGGNLPVVGASEMEISGGMPINEALHYKIQVASTQKPLDAAYLEGFEMPMIEKMPDFAYYRYTLGAFTDRSEAERFRQKMKANGRTSAFLATYRQGWRMER